MTIKQKRLILLNIAFVLMGLFATNLGEAWRISQTIDAINEVGALTQALVFGALLTFLRVTVTTTLVLSHRE